MQVKLNEIYKVQTYKYNQYQKIKKRQELILEVLFKFKYDKHLSDSGIATGPLIKQNKQSYLSDVIAYNAEVKANTSASKSPALYDYVIDALEETVFLMNEYKNLWMCSAMINQNDMYIKILPDRLIIDEENIIYVDQHKKAISRKNDIEKPISHDRLNELLNIEVDAENCPKWIQDALVPQNVLKRERTPSKLN